MAARFEDVTVQYGGLFVGTKPSHCFATTRSPLRGDDPASAADDPAASAVSTTAAAPNLTADDRRYPIVSLLSHCSPLGTPHVRWSIVPAFCAIRHLSYPSSMAALTGSDYRGVLDVLRIAHEGDDGVPFSEDTLAALRRLIP